MPRDLPTAPDPVPAPPGLAAMEEAGTDASGDEHARVRHEQIARIRTVAQQIAISRGLAVTDADRWIADTRRYLRHLLDYAPYVEGVYPCKVLSIGNRTLRYCTVELLATGEIIPHVQYDPTAPSIDQEYAVRETKRLNPLHERGLPEHVHWTLKVPGGQFIYWAATTSDADGNPTGSTVYRQPWPGAERDEVETLFTMPTRPGLNYFRDTAGGTPQIAPSLVGVDGNGYVWMQYDFVENWRVAMDFRVDNTEPATDYHDPPANALLAYANGGQVPLDYTPTESLVPPGLRATWADMTPGCTNLAAMQPHFIDMGIYRETTLFGGEVTVTTAGPTVDLQPIFPGSDSFRNACPPGAYPNPAVYSVHEAAFPELFNFNEHVCALHIHWARNTWHVAPIRASGTTPFRYLRSMEFWLGKGQPGPVPSLGWTSDGEALIDSPPAPVSGFNQGFNVQYGGSMGFTHGPVPRPSGDAEAPYAGIDGSWEQYGLNTGGPRLADDAGVYYSVGTFVTALFGRTEGVRFDAQRVWTPVTPNGLGVPVLLSPYGVYDDPARAAGTWREESRGSRGLFRLRDTANRSDVRLEYNCAGARQAQSRPERFATAWQAGGPREDSTEIDAIAVWASPNPEAPSNNRNPHTYWKHGGAQPISNWERAPFARYVAQDRTMANLLVALASGALRQTVDSGEHFTACPWLNGVLSHYGNAVIVSV